MLVPTLLHEVEPAAAVADELGEGLVVDRVQLRRGARLDARGRLAEPEMGDRQAQVLDALHAVRARMSARVAVVALAHELGELGARAHKLPESVVLDLRPRVARREVLRVEPEAEDLLLQGHDAPARARPPELERLAAAARQVAPAVAEAHEIREFLGGYVVHRVGVSSTRVCD